jgi:hypothetical protein
MKVKLFLKRNASGGSGFHASSATVGGQNLKELEDAVNIWLQENPNTKVIKIKQSSSAEGWFFGVLNSICISIWYE